MFLNNMDDIVRSLLSLFPLEIWQHCGQEKNTCWDVFSYYREKNSRLRKSYGTSILDRTLYIWIFNLAQKKYCSTNEKAAFESHEKLDRGKVPIISFPRVMGV